MSGRWVSEGMGKGGAMRKLWVSKADGWGRGDSGVVGGSDGFVILGCGLV